MSTNVYLRNVFLRSLEAKWAREKLCDERAKPNNSRAIGVAQLLSDQAQSNYARAVHAHTKQGSPG